VWSKGQLTTLRQYSGQEAKFNFTRQFPRESRMRVSHYNAAIVTSICYCIFCEILLLIEDKMKFTTSGAFSVVFPFISTCPQHLMVMFLLQFARR
jgi:hypothetical protein